MFMQTKGKNRWTVLVDFQLPRGIHSAPTLPDSAGRMSGRMTAEDHGPCPLRLSNGSATRGHQAESEGQKERGSGISSPLPPHQSTSSHYVPLPVVNLSFHDHIPAGF